MAGHREEVVLATKYTLSNPGKDPNAAGNHRKNMMQSVAASLKRLKTDYIDLYWLHIWDFMTPVDEEMRAFDDLVRQGTILYVGISDTPAWVIARSNTMAELRLNPGRAPIEAPRRCQPHRDGIFPCLFRFGHGAGLHIRWTVRSNRRPPSEIVIEISRGAPFKSGLNLAHTLLLPIRAKR
jgi:hypothetical protein